MSARSTTSYKDGWSLGLWLFILMMDISVAFALWAAFDLRTAIGSAAIVIALSIFASQKSPLRIEISGDWLHVGRAKIERCYLGEVEILNEKEMALRRTRDADPRAYLQLRFWVKPGLAIHIEDERDSHPYWLVSTRRGKEIASLLKN